MTTETASGVPSSSQTLIVYFLTVAGDIDIVYMYSLLGDLVFKNKDSVFTSIKVALVAKQPANA